MTDYENLYIVRINGNEPSKEEKFSDLEDILAKDPGARIRFSVKPVMTVSAEIHSKDLLGYLKDSGYEVIRDKKTKMI